MLDLHRRRTELYFGIERQQKGERAFRETTVLIYPGEVGGMCCGVQEPQCFGSEQKEENVKCILIIILISFYALDWLLLKLNKNVFAVSLFLQDSTSPRISRLATYQHAATQQLFCTLPGPPENETLSLHDALPIAS